MIQEKGTDKDPPPIPAKLDTTPIPPPYIIVFAELGITFWLVERMDSSICNANTKTITPNTFGKYCAGITSGDMKEPRKPMTTTPGISHFTTKDLDIA